MPTHLIGKGARWSSFQVGPCNGAWRIYGPSGQVLGDHPDWIAASFLAGRLARTHPPARLEILNQDGQIALTHSYEVRPSAAGALPVRISSALTKP